MGRMLIATNRADAEQSRSCSGGAKGETVPATLREVLSQVDDRASVLQRAGAASSFVRVETSVRTAGATCHGAIVVQTRRGFMSVGEDAAARSTVALTRSCTASLLLSPLADEDLVQVESTPRMSWMDKIAFADRLCGLMSLWPLHASSGLQRRRSCTAPYAA